MNIQLADPAWLWALPPLALWAAGWGGVLVRAHRRRWRTFLAADRQAPSLARVGLTSKLVTHMLVVFAIAWVIVALARPQGARSPSTSSRHGVNLAILLDGSRSMLAEDVLPNRLQLAQRAVEVLSEEATGSRFSFFMFGGTPTLLIPQTFDSTAVTLAARSVSPDFVGKGGTALGPAIERATRYLQRAPRTQPKVIVILSDGEDGEGDPLLPAMQAQTQGIVIHTITLGTKDGGPMPLYEREASGELTRIGEYPGGSEPPVITHADPVLMERLADVTGGLALHLTASDVRGPVGRLSHRAILAQAVPLDDVASEEPREWFWLPILAAVLTLLIEQGLRRALAHSAAQVRKAPSGVPIIRTGTRP